MVKREKLYDAFGDLIYAVAIADGAVQEVEIETLANLLESHAGKAEIKWSFDYDCAKSKSVEETYRNAIEVCKENGPDAEYKKLIEIMVEVAKSYMGIVPSEQKIMDAFVEDLKAKFLKDLEDHHLV